MPTITLKTNKTIEKNTELALKTAFGNAISLIPGKSEAWLMCIFEGDKNIYFKGNDDVDCALIAADIKGSASASDFKALGGEITDNVSQLLKIDPSNIYISFTEYEHFMWNGAML